MKVTLIRFSSLGDCILLCPLAAYLKSEGAEVSIVTKRAYAELFAAATGVDRVVAIDPSRGLSGLMAAASSLSSSDAVVIDAHNNTRSRLLSARLGGATVRLGKYYRERVGLIIFKRSARIPTILENYAGLAAGAGLPVPRLSPGGLKIPDVHRARATGVQSGGPYVAIAPGSRWPQKRWPSESYAALAQRLTAGGMRVLLVGDTHDREAARRVSDDLGPACVDVTGSLGVMETAAHLAASSLFVGNDSGLTHLAEAVGVPVVSIFGPTVSAFGYAPALEGSRLVEAGLECRPCSRNGSAPCVRGNNECMTAITVDQVFDAVEGILNARSVRS